MSTELATTSFDNKESFDHIQRVATMFSKSDMIPKRYFGNIGNCIIALEMANRMKASPLMVMQNLDVIQGKPGWSSVFLIATLNSSGKFSPLRYEEDEKNGGRCRAWAIDKGTNDKLFGPWVSMEMAAAEGWSTKAGSKWKTMPELMMRYRAASFYTKQFAPEVSMGLQTIEEVIDITTIQKPEKESADKVLERHAMLAVDAIEESTTLAQLAELRGKIGSDVAEFVVAGKSITEWLNEKMEGFTNE
jgi:hypothetical protein